MRNCILLLVVAGLLGGCQYFDKRYSANVPDSKADSYKRWGHARTEILCSVADQYIKTGQLDNAASRLNEALHLEETNVQAHVLLGRVYIEQGQYPQAEKELSRARQLDANNAEAEYLMGVAKEKDGRLDEALACYRKAQSMEEGNLPAIMAAAEVYVAMGQPQQAQKYLNGYMSSAGADPGMHELAGRLSMMNRDYAGAARSFQKACDADPKNVSYREALAAARFSARQYAETLSVLLMLSELKSYKMPAWAHRMKGDCYLALARYAEARASYQLAAEINSDSAAAWLQVAQAAMLAGDFTRAIQSARRATQLEPANVEAFMMLGYATLRNGEAVQALDVLTPISTTHPRDTMLLCLLGRCYAAAGKPAAARNCYDKALQIDPANKLAQELIATCKSTEKTKVD